MYLNGLCDIDLKEEFDKCAYSLSCRKIDKKIDTLMSVQKNPNIFSSLVVRYRRFVTAPRIVFWCTRSTLLVLSVGTKTTWLDIGKDRRRESCACTPNTCLETFLLCKLCYAMPSVQFSLPDTKLNLARLDGTWRAVKKKNLYLTTRGWETNTLPKYFQLRLSMCLLSVYDYIIPQLCPTKIT